MKLVVEDDAGKRSELPFASDELAVGRAEGNALRLPDRNVSRRHARFVKQKGDVLVEDLGSLTGTFVNGERIDGRRKLRPGDIVQIGDHDLAVLGDGEALPPPAAAPPGAEASPGPAAAEPTVLLATAEIRAIAAGAMTPPASTAPSRPAGAAAVSPRRPLGAAVVAGALALLVGAAAGWAVGTYVVPPAAAAGPR